ncbi:hypothetical protein ACTI_63120 [Actinoplanes sp. OR16]|nr:hypothetical protein ACTI_63120 [Actinoplanes sp. OR16]
MCRARGEAADSRNGNRPRRGLLAVEVLNHRNTPRQGEAAHISAGEEADERAPGRCAPPQPGDGAEVKDPKYRISAVTAENAIVSAQRPSPHR